MSILLELLDRISGQRENQHIFLIRQLKHLEQSFLNCGHQLFNCIGMSLCYLGFGFSGF